MGLTCEAEDVRSLLLDLAESLGCSGNSLVYDDCLHERIIGKSYDDCDCCFLLVHEVVRICDVLDHAAVLDCTILSDESLSTSEIILTLGYGTGYDTDVECVVSLYSFFLCTVCKDEGTCKKHNQ